MFEVIEAGLWTTVQDAGRPGFGHLGVREAGAADGLALRAANLLVGNRGRAPVLEMTLLGGTFAVRSDTLVGITGADMGAQVTEEGRSLTPGGSYRLRAGTTLAFGAALDGARTYVALPGGVPGDVVLGSASTDPIAGFGGIEGRCLRAGDILSGARARPVGERRWPVGQPSSGVWTADGPLDLAIVPGPHRDLLPAVLSEALAARPWMVTPDSDRVGLRLDGEPLPGAGRLDLVSLPMLPGAIQVPPGGRPIVLMPDAPTVGGYPVPAVISEVDRYRLGQLRPGDALRFTTISIEEARGRKRRWSEALHSVAGQLA